MKVLVCPLNWGLGHATRCIPLIEDFVSNGHEVVLAADGLPLNLLQQEFPDLEIIRFPSYKFSYSRGKSQVMAMWISLPGIISGIIREHYWLKHLLKRQHFDLILSDNRFGLWHKSVKSVYMTHQISIRMPRGLQWAETLIRALHLKIINQYDECLIPDYQGDKNLSGELSHGFALPKHVKFTGPLSRFRNFRATTPTKNFDIVALVSGPEPQRTLFEAALTEICLKSGRKSLLIQGLPGKEANHNINNQLTIVPHISSNELGNILYHAKIIYCRSGYSTLMDLEELGCLDKAVLIPTPGQTEQEYLGKYHADNKINLLFYQ